MELYAEEIIFKEQCPGALRVVGPDIHGRGAAAWFGAETKAYPGPLGAAANRLG